MNDARLTVLHPLARSPGMTWGHLAKRAARIAIGGAAALGLAACISVETPDKPIVIELNINIKQEVIYRLAADAENTIEENTDIF